MLITTGEGKYYCNGLDLDWLKPTLETTGYGPVFGRKWNGTITRLLTFPMPTIAAMNGNSFVLHPLPICRIIIVHIKHSIMIVVNPIKNFYLFCRPCFCRWGYHSNVP